MTEEDPPGGERLPDSLSSAERETLQRALEMGYFRVPREATIGEIAAGLGITDQEVSEHLRRGLELVLHESGLIDSSRPE